MFPVGIQSKLVNQKWLLIREKSRFTGIQARHINKCYATWRKMGNLLFVVNEKRIFC